MIAESSASHSARSVGSPESAPGSIPPCSAAISAAGRWRRPASQPKPEKSAARRPASTSSWCVRTHSAGSTGSRGASRTHRHRRTPTRRMACPRPSRRHRSASARRARGSRPPPTPPAASATPARTRAPRARARSAPRGSRRSPPAARCASARRAGRRASPAARAARQRAPTRGGGPSGPAGLAQRARSWVRSEETGSHGNDKLIRIPGNLRAFSRSGATTLQGRECEIRSVREPLHSDVMRLFITTLKGRGTQGTQDPAARRRPCSFWDAYNCRSGIAAPPPPSGTQSGRAGLPRSPDRKPPAAQGAAGHGTQTKLRDPWLRVRPGQRSLGSRSFERSRTSWALPRRTGARSGPRGGPALPSLTIEQRREPVVCSASRATSRAPAPASV